MAHRRPARRLVPLLVLPLALPLALAAGCAQSESSETSPSVETPGTSEPVAPEVADTTPDLLAAAETALSEIRRGTVFSIEQDDAGWEVEVLDQDGTINDIGVSADGTTVTSGPDAEDDDITTRTEQRAFARNISIGYADAIEAALEAAPAATGVTEVDLDQADGIIDWVVTLDDGSTVEVNAGTGEVVDADLD